MSEKNPESLFHQRIKSAGKTIPVEDDDTEYSACSFGRVSSKPQLSITFRTINGSGYNFVYSHLYGTHDVNPNAGFIVEFSRHRVTVEGRNLERLHRLLCDQKVREVREVEELHSQALPENEPVVTRLTIREKGPHEEF